MAKDGKHLFESLGLGVADWVIWYMIFEYVGLGVVVVYWLYRSRFKIGCKAVFVRRSGEKVVEGEAVELDPIDVEYGYSLPEQVRSGEYVVVGEVEFKPTAVSVRFRKRTFMVDLAYVAFRKFGFTYFLFDWDLGASLRFGGEKVGVDAEVVDLFTESGVIAQLVARVKGIDRMMLALIIVVIVAIGVGAGLGGYLLGSMGNHTVVGVLGVV
jgi:hypothetical protein